MKTVGATLVAITSSVGAAMPRSPSAFDLLHNDAWVAAEPLLQSHLLRAFNYAATRGMR
jgi:hypothetical protein